MWSDIKVRELDISGIVRYEFVPTGQTINQLYYLEVLKRLREKVRRKRPELFANNSWTLHHDNAPAHTALSVREFLATKQITVQCIKLCVYSHKYAVKTQQISKIISLYHK